MTDKNNNLKKDMPPVPRDATEASYSELIPIRSKSINVLKSPLFYLVVLTAFIAIAMFRYRVDTLTTDSYESFTYLFWAAILYLLGIVLLIVFLYSKTDKPFWCFCLSTVFVSCILLSPLIETFFFIFRTVLPGDIGKPPGDGFIKAFIGNFFGAGLMEELIKVTLVLAGAYIVINRADWKDKLPAWLFDAISIRGPLDGLLMGLFGGAGFILVETAMQYVPNDVVRMATSTGNLNAGFASGLMLLLPRVIGGMVGHMAWAGITGYFIGLMVIRPAEAVKFVLFAWLGTATLHAIWNTQTFIPIFSYVSALASGAFLVACLLKARQLDMSLGHSVDSYGSIVVNPNPGSASGSGDHYTDQTPVQVSPRVQPSSVEAAAQLTAVLGLVFGETTIPVEPGKIVNLGGIPELSDRGAGIVGEVTRHPTRHDVLGLKNLGAEAWIAHLRDGTEQPIDTQRNIRLAPGVKIDFGRGLQAEVKNI
jgi:RsiW-degrading membrane proteinase PrsW (M82 family)